MRIKNHKIYVHLANGQIETFMVRGLTRQDAKYTMFNLIFKYAAICRKYVGAYIPKFNPQTYLAQVAA